MSYDQLEDYRRRMEQRHKNREAGHDESIARQLQLEEEQRANERMQQDEEIAKKLQAQYQPAPNYYQHPPVDPYRQPLLQNRESCLPVVDDKCCGVNTQTCVLCVAGMMALGAIAYIIMLATA